MEIEMNIKMTDKKGNVITRMIKTEVPEVIEFGNPEEFYEIFDRFERPVIEAGNQMRAEIAEAYLEEAVKQKKRNTTCN